MNIFIRSYIDNNMFVLICAIILCMLELKTEVSYTFYIVRSQNTIYYYPTALINLNLVNKTKYLKFMVLLFAKDTVMIFMKII